MQWKILDRGVSSAESNMEVDFALLKGLQKDPGPILHLYDWAEDSASYGYFLDPLDFLKNDGIAKRKLKLVRRPTGGGILFHLTDFTFSILLPARHRGYTVNTMQNYAFVHWIIADVIQKFTHMPAILMPKMGEDCCSGRQFCMAGPTECDVMIEGRKVAGGAQRRTKHGFLHQGSVSLMGLSSSFLSDVLKDTSLIKKMEKVSYPLSEAFPDKKLPDLKKEFKQLLCEEIGQMD